MQLQFRRAGLLALLAVSAFAPGIWAQGSGSAAMPAGDLSTDTELAALCAQGDGAACLMQGEQLYAQRGDGADAAGALALFGAACDLGEAGACLRLGGELEFPDFGETDSEGALAAYTRACALGAAQGCDRAGIAADDLSTDDAAGAPLPPAGPAQAASSDEAIVVGVITPPAEEPVTGFASEALPDLDMAATQAVTEAAPETEAGETGLFVTQVVEEAPAPSEEDLLLAEERRAMADACGRGEMEACEMFAAWLRDGTGGEADPVRARRVFSVICTEGSVRGCYELGWMMYDAGIGSGSGLDTDELEISRARFLFAETCKAGIFEACLQGADMRANGVGGRVDTDGAGRLYAIACEAGLEAGCLMAAPKEAPEEALVVAAEAGEAEAAEAETLEAETPEPEAAPSEATAEN